MVDGRPGLGPERGGHGDGTDRLAVPSTTTTVSPLWYRSDTARSMEAGRPVGTTG